MVTVEGVKDLVHEFVQPCICENVMVVCIM